MSERGPGSSLGHSEVSLPFIFKIYWGMCKISCERNAYCWEELKTNGTKLVQGITVWMRLYHTLFRYWSGFSFLLCVLTCLFEL